MTIDVRTVTEGEFPDWVRARKVGFLEEPAVTEAQLAARRRNFVAGRLLGAFDAGRCVATFRSFAQEVTAVGGAPVAANAISNVTVTATHRRRGLLSRMMRRDLAAARERGDTVATLIAAEYPIYGRYGFGPATHTTRWTVEVPRAGLDPRSSGPEDGGRIDLVDLADVRELGPELHDRWRSVTPGAVSRDALWWDRHTGTADFGTAWKEPFHAVYRSASGQVEGMMAYAFDDEWKGTQPSVTASVEWVLAATPGAERALWRFLCSVDWTVRVDTGWLGPDALLPHLLPDPRAARVTDHADFLWVRVLDVVRALESRTYAAPGTLVLDVRDEDGPAAGRYRLDAGPDGATCAPAPGATPDLTLPAAELASLWLGDQSAARLAALGRLTENTPGAVQRATPMFRGAVRPWCPDAF
ncbi:GNAT family N-acetyltransferase [Streptomyces sp. J2-1]|uniref:GNAT family N-acetyltransferase n=1 Tax=Streptomyces corallincola TaxID=2851888 RepID=UPI001C38BBEB|nr:GNAT family N-acetyltransferase [Streptomyces corallincola]MBV2356842.1 GNAT family N-acetyltransferase [Streptomyces corallincola]